MFLEGYGSISKTIFVLARDLLPYTENRRVFNGRSMLATTYGRCMSTFSSQSMLYTAIYA